MTEPRRDLNHLYLEGPGQATRYEVQGNVRAHITPRDDRAAHAAALAGQLALARQALSGLPRDPVFPEGPQGQYLDFELTGRDADKALLQRLEGRRQGIEVASVRRDPATNRVIATVVVPETAAEAYDRRIHEYASVDTPGGKPKRASLVTNIEGIRHAALRSIFVGDAASLPGPGAAVWWEVWVRQGAAEEFRQVARRVELTVAEERLTFPDREVLLVHGSFDALSRIFLHTVVMAELRLSRDTPDVFVRMNNAEQAQWVDEAATRLLTPDASVQTSVLLLDSGVTRPHPLIATHLHPNDWQTWHPHWGPDDSGWEGHGTAMSGLILHGDVLGFLLSSAAVRLSHRLESVKILPPAGHNPYHLYGRITQDAVRQMEGTNPERQRVICLAVTATLDVNRGRPTAWSAALDQLTSGGGDEPQRLAVVAAGNNAPAVPDLLSDYLGSADTAQVHSPAQAWNVLTVGAYTDKTNLLDPRYTGWWPVAPGGDLSPTSSTSVLWQEQWPIKPEIVMEGGNLIVNGGTFDAKHPDVRLLTADFDLTTGHLRDFGDTSAAAALGARMAAQLAAEFPHYWPETIRALMVHSAEWTPAMQARLAGPRRLDVRNLLRRYGYGVPQLERARRSARNDLTLVIQDALRPFEAVGGRTRMNEMHLHRFPWSAIDTAALEGLDLEMRVTLSYFVEPNPSERGYAQRFRYASHGLRFAVKGPLETEADFKARIQRESLPNEGSSIRDAGNDHWAFGPKLRTSGSIHSDRWRGDIATLQACEAVLVYPVSGWWREKRGGTPPYVDRDARYGLIVSLRVLEADVDIYTPIATALSIPVETTV